MVATHMSALVDECNRWEAGMFLALVAPTEHVALVDVDGSWAAA